MNKKKNRGIEKTVLHGGFYDGTISVQRTFVAPLKKHLSWVSSIQIDENEDTVISGEERGAINIWEVDETQQKFSSVRLILNHEDTVSDICFKTKMDLFATSSFDGTINLYFKHSRKLIWTFYNPSKDLKFNRVWIIESPLPSVIGISYKSFISFSLNG